MRFGVETHGTGAPLGGDIFHDRVLVRRILVNNREDAFAARGEGIVCCGIETVGIDTLPNGGSSNDFAGVGVNDSHHLVLAAGEEPVILGVEGKAGG